MKHVALPPPSALLYGMLVSATWTFAAHAAPPPQERKYAFHAQLEEVHRPGRRNAALQPGAAEFAFADGAVIRSAAYEALRQGV
ncbi:MAG: hypothetical protein IKJ45_08475, partial [Kiritimatiellae bacterium]|nr:hypothetical protein [Kiritimatiellia bacterium]